MSAVTGFVVLVAATDAARADAKPTSGVTTVAVAPPSPGSTSREEVAQTERPVVRPAAYLTPEEIAAVVAPHGDDIERCYLDQAGELKRTGKLDVTFGVGRNGRVFSLRAAVRGAKVKALHKIEDCIRSAVESVQFPSRRNDTTAVVPYLFHKAASPGSGPQLSCWNATGCH